MCAEMLKKAARPASNWKALSPSLEPWFEELDSILKTIQVIEHGVSGKSASERAREIHSPTEIHMHTPHTTHYNIYTNQKACQQIDASHRYIILYY